MTIDATDVRDLINNPEGRTPYPEDNKLMLGSASDDSQIQDILNRLSALENAESSSDDYKLRARDHNSNIEVALLKNDSAIAPEIDFPADSFFYETVGTDVVIHSPKQRAFVYNNSNLDTAPNFANLSAELKGTTGSFGYDTNNWTIWWDRIKTPFTNQNYHHDEAHTDVNTIHSNCYSTHNKLMFGADIASSPDPTTHKLELAQFFNYVSQIINTFVNGTKDNYSHSFDLSIESTEEAFFMPKLQGSDKEKYLNLFRPFRFDQFNPSNMKGYILGAYLPSVLSGYTGSLTVIITWDSKYYGDTNNERRTYIQ